MIYQHQFGHKRKVTYCNLYQGFMDHPAFCSLLDCLLDLVFTYVSVKPCLRRRFEEHLVQDRQKPFVVMHNLIRASGPCIRHPYRRTNHVTNMKNRKRNSLALLLALLDCEFSLLGHSFRWYILRCDLFHDHWTVAPELRPLHWKYPVKIGDSNFYCYIKYVSQRSP